MNLIKKTIDAAAGRNNVELVLKNCKIINVFSNEIIEGNLAISYGKIIGMGDYIGKKEIDLKGKYVCPGLIDGHVHIESSMVSPIQFARAVVPRGTTTIIADPHEIANVCGIEGIKYMLDQTENIPLNVFIMLPSCVPATSFETSGAVLNAEDLNELINNPRVLGLGEMMNYPGVINCEQNVLDKIDLAIKNGKIVDGHGPSISGKSLNAYSISGVKTEHECSTVEEMIERIRNGMYISIREGSAAKNLRTLLKGVNSHNLRRCMLCADDRHPEDILKEGHIDNSIRIAIKEGFDPIDAIKMATLNTAECYGLKNLGAIAPGYNADLLVLDNLVDFNIVKVLKDGKEVAEDLMPSFYVKESDDVDITNTINLKELKKEDLNIKLNSDSAKVISLLPNSIVTKEVKRKVLIDASHSFKYDKNSDILKIAVIERHKGTGNIGLGLVENFGLKNGAIASTVAHDSHNIIVIGDNDEDMIKAVEKLKSCKGGITICSEGKILETLKLPIAGLMSNISMEIVREKLETMLQLAYEKLNVNKNIQPFMTLAFLALPVIPELRITDKGLFDVDKFQFTNIEVQ